MLALVNSCALMGVDGYPLTVEVDVSPGIARFDIVGLPDAAVKESRERVRAALRNSGFEFPLRRLTVNLAPANIRKEGSVLDLPIAVGILAATGQLSCDESFLRQGVFVGELSLEGAVRPISGALSMAACVARQGLSSFFLPAANAKEAAIAQGVQVYGVEELRQLTEQLSGDALCSPVTVDVQALFRQSLNKEEELDMADVKGQEGVKRALTVAAAGGHNVLMIGPPGSGKTMLAKRMPGLLPPLSLEESIEATKLYSVSGLLPKDQPLLTVRPFRAPHHGASAASIIGGGANPRPGEISLASHGILFMDELPEFSRDVLEALRQPLEERRVTVARVNARVNYPADFQLIAAMNPCPCGYYGDGLKECTCTPYARERYMQRLSGPLLDRIDLHISVPRTEYRQLSGKEKSVSSAELRRQVTAAREIQAKRFPGKASPLNASMTRRELEQFCRCDRQASVLLEQAFRMLKMSARAHDRILKVARTIADLDGAEQIGQAHIAEAIQYRSLDRKEV
ncbi:MAG: YifB family Mg chelatase-like AAA ATPase [Firmicutes bacterium]|nr:YifB family Mg chelatase-like AAA ATPase [Bacillota bacterium]